MMRTLRLRNVGWCEAHGNPVATLSVDGDTAFVGVAISVADAQAMSAAAISGPAGGDGHDLPESARIYSLVELIAGSLGGRLTAIDLSVGSDRIIRTWLRLDGPLGSCSVPAAFSDALVLAQRNPVPLRIENQSFERLMGTTDSPPEASGADVAAQPDETSSPDAFHAFRAFVNGLDLEQLG